MLIKKIKRSDNRANLHLITSKYVEINRIGYDNNTVELFSFLKYVDGKQQYEYEIVLKNDNNEEETVVYIEIFRYNQINLK